MIHYLIFPTSNSHFSSLSSLMSRAPIFLSFPHRPQKTWNHLSSVFLPTSSSILFFLTFVPFYHHHQALAIVILGFKSLHWHEVLAFLSSVLSSKSCCCSDLSLRRLISPCHLITQESSKTLLSNAKILTFWPCLHFQVVTKIIYFQFIRDKLIFSKEMITQL